MITEFKYSYDHDRNFGSLKNELLSGKLKIIDVGASITSHYESQAWIEKARFATVDLFDIPNSKLHFKGNISLFTTWFPILDYVKKHGKFDFCYLSHTLEDISNPKLVCNLLGDIAKRGFIAVPSKYTECKRLNNLYRGYIHHRWIYNIENNIFKAYPKQNFLEYEKHLDDLAQKHNVNNAELQIFWENEIDLKIINDDFLGPTIDAVINYYKNLHLN